MKITRTLTDGYMSKQTIYCGFIIIRVSKPQNKEFNKYLFP